MNIMETNTAPRIEPAFPEDAALIPAVPPYHKETELDVLLRDMVKRTWDKPEHLRVTNIKLQGIAGTGKSEAALVLAAELGLPFTSLTCFGDMDSTHLYGQGFPDFDDELGVLKVRFMLSEFVKAFERGWVLELAEPTVVNEASMLMALSTALEKVGKGVLNLPDRRVPRHPNFVCVMTMNPAGSYFGTRPLNQALNDRMDVALTVELPPRDACVERVAHFTGAPEPLCALGVDLAFCLRAAMQEHHILEGELGFRSIFNFVNLVHAGFPTSIAATSAVISKISSDPEDLAFLADEVRLHMKDVM